MSHQITKVDLIPNGELSVCNVSQFDNGRVLPFEILENKEAYNIPNDIRVEIHCRKPDGNIVTLPSDTITDNIVTFITTTQLTACYGDNVCEISLYGADDYLIGSANFILEVEKSPTYGGINSTSDIHNLESQIRGIAEDVIPEILPDYLDNYYTKSEVNALIDNIFPTFTASGAIASFITALTKPLISVTTAEGANTVTRCGVNMWGGETLADAFVAADNYYKNTTTKTVTFSAYKVAPYLLTLFNKFKENTQYTIILRYSAITNNNSIRIVYSDETYTSLQLLATNEKTDYVFITPAGKTVSNIMLTYYSAGVVTVYYDESGVIEGVKTVEDFTPYNGQTVPVSEATTLLTLSGVNNVFADVGAVTVGYKYMSMPETQTNSNRLTLSSVNSDIIKEKSEIKDQSDIIEDIERGEENE